MIPIGDDIINRWISRFSFVVCFFVYFTHCVSKSDQYQNGLSLGTVITKETKGPNNWVVPWGLYCLVALFLLFYVICAFVDLLQWIQKRISLSFRQIWSDKSFLKKDSFGLDMRRIRIQINLTDRWSTLFHSQWIWN